MNLPQNYINYAFNYDSQSGRADLNVQSGQENVKVSNIPIQDNTRKGNQASASEMNPYRNPIVESQFTKKIDIEHMRKNARSLSKLDLARLARASYLEHANRYNVQS